MNAQGFVFEENKYNMRIIRPYFLFRFAKLNTSYNGFIILYTQAHISTHIHTQTA